MAITDTQKVDYLFKKVGYGVTKTDTNANKLAPNESIPSPFLLRGDRVWAESGDIPAVKPTADTDQVKLYSAVECTQDITATANRTWKTGITDWIPPEFGSTYLVSVYIHTSGDAAGAEVISNKVFVTGTNNNDEWFFDYQSGVLNFIGTNLPDGKSFTGKSVYITGAVYDGPFGVGDATVTNNINSALAQEITDRTNADTALQDQINDIISNTDPAALDSLTEIVTAFQNADSAFATTTDLTNLQVSTSNNLTNAISNLNTQLRNDLAVPVGNFEAPEFFYGDGNTTQFTLSHEPVASEAIDVYVNSVIQHTDVFSLSADVITFSTTPAMGDEIYVKYRSPYATVNVLPADSVENSMLNLTYTSNQFTGSTSTTYTIQAGHSVHSVLVIIDGLIIAPNEYTVNGTTLTLNTSPSVNSVVDIRYMPV